MNTKILLIISFLFVSSYAFSQKKILIDEAINNLGEMVTICDKIVDARYLQGSPGKFTLLNVGARFPNQKLTIVINENSRSNFPLADAIAATALSKPNPQLPLIYRKGGVKTKDKYFTINLKLGMKLPQF
jgi:hypothetical protein